MSAEAMKSGGTVTGVGPNREFLLSRVFDARRERVWQAFSEAAAMAQWWGPKGFAIEVAQLDFRPGGIFHYSLKTPDGIVMWGKFEYREMVAPACIVFANSFSDAAGGVVRHPWSPAWPLQVLNILTLTENDGRTTLTLRGWPQDATDAERLTFAGSFDSLRVGFTGSFDQLDAYLARTAAAGAP